MRTRINLQAKDFYDFDAIDLIVHAKLLAVAETLIRRHMPELGAVYCLRYVLQSCAIFFLTLTKASWAILFYPFMISNGVTNLPHFGHFGIASDATLTRIFWFSKILLKSGNVDL